MKRILLVLVGVATLAACADAQEKTGLSKPKPKPVASADAFVTQTDAKAVFQRAEKLLRTATKTTAQVAPIPLTGTGPVSRAQTVAQFARLYEIVRPKMKLTPRPVKVNVGVLKMSGPAKDQLVKLVKLGAIGNYGPLAAGPADKLTVAQFGDALGFFLARMAEITHTPSTKYSPPLMGGE